MKIPFVGIFLLLFLSACAMEVVQGLPHDDKSENDIMLVQAHKEDGRTDQKNKGKRIEGEVLFCGKNNRKIALSFSKDNEIAFIYFFESGKRIELSNTHVGSGMEYEKDYWLLRGKDRNTALYQFGTKMMCQKKQRAMK